MEISEDNVINIEPPKDEVVVPKNIVYRILDKCANIKSSIIKNRAYVNIFSAVAGSMILKNYDIECNTNFGLQQIISVVSKLDISELFVGQCRISVRYVFDDYKPFIPKKHEKYGLFGHLFMFVKIDENYNAKLLGFLPPKNLNKTNSDDENYYVELDELMPIDSVRNYFGIKSEFENITEMKQERRKIIEYYEGNLEDNIAFFNLLANSRYLREEMIQYELSRMVYSEVINREYEIKRELERDLDKISRLADAFIQSKNEILTHSESAENFKLECARANLEKLFNTPSYSQEETIEDKSSEDVMDILLTQSEYTIKDDKLPTGVFRFFFTFVVCFVLIFGCLFYFHYNGTIKYEIKSVIKNNVVKTVGIIKSFDYKKYLYTIKRIWKKSKNVNFSANSLNKK